MVEARVTQAIVVEDEKTLQPVLMGVVSYGDERMNFKMPFSLEDVEDHPEEIFKALRDQIASDFEIRVYHVDLMEDLLLKRMLYFAKQHRGTVH